MADLGSGGIFQLLDHHRICDADARHIIYHVAAPRILQRPVFLMGLGVFALFALAAAGILGLVLAIFVFNKNFG